MNVAYPRNDKIIRRKFYQYLIPTVLMVLAMQFGSLADAIVIGNFLGDAALSASSLALPAVFLVEIPAMMIGVGASIVGANFIGKRMVKEASQTFKLAMLLSFLFSLIFIPIGIFAGDEIAKLFAGQFQDLAPMIAQYIKVFACQAPLLGVGITLAYFLSSDNNPNLGAAFFIIANIAHIGSEILFCLFLDPSLAMWGVAASTGIGMLAGMVVFIPYLKSKRRVVDMTVSMKGAFSLTPSLLRAGSSSGALMVLSFAYFLILNIAAINYLSDVEMPLYAMLSNFSFVIDLFVLGILQIMPSVISSLFGEKDYFSIRSIVRRVFLITMGVTTALTVISIAFPQLFFWMFGVDLGSIQQGMAGDPLAVVRIYCISFLLYSVNKFFAYYYPSIMRNSPAMVANVVHSGLVGPVTIFFLMQAQSVMGYAYGSIIMEAATLLLTVGFILLGKKLGRFSGDGLLLLPKAEKNEQQIELSIPAKTEEISKIVEELQRYALELGGDEKAAGLLALASEEIIANTMTYGFRRNAASQYIDINLAKTETGLLVRIRDDGIAFDPTALAPGEEEEMRYNGIPVIRKVASEFKYLRLLNTNNTIMEIAIGK
ncbi:MAG: ATP-binding protein [Bacilli bacterium]|nr:ATP-binding protein [Bacilli bacterium]